MKLIGIEEHFLTEDICEAWKASGLEAHRRLCTGCRQLSDTDGRRGPSCRCQWTPMKSYSV